MTASTREWGPGLVFAPEERLLLACALSPELFCHDSMCVALKEVTAWNRFTEQAVAAKFAPLVYARLSESPKAGAIPKPVLMRLGAASVAAEGANRRLLAERDRLLDRFATRGVTPLPLKGCALADTLYRDPALRPMGDLDLLFRAEQFADGVRLLLEDGYRTDGVEARGETFFYQPDTRLFIDAHTALDPSGRFRIRSADLWRDAALLPDGRSRLTLSAQHHFVHALLHAARHRLDSLGPLVDAAWLASRWPEAMCWETLPALARRWRCGAALGFALEAATLLFRLPVPPEALERLRLRGWRREVTRRLWPGASPLESLEKRSRAARYLFSAATTAPGGFAGALVRFRRTRRVEDERRSPEPRPDDAPK